MKKFLSGLVLGSIVNKTTVDRPFDEVLAALKQSIAANGFTVSVEHDLRATFQKNNLPLPDDFAFTIVQFCNAKKVHPVLMNLSFDVGIMMPKSIVVARENGVTTLRFMQMKSWMVGWMFPSINLVPVSKNVMATIRKIVRDAVAIVEK